ncbi:MAG: hypothetical protein JJE53_03605 [Candidatus Pacebacteria bacterium]|nr:hypothetical protein [Candidatus Paceibacterota bacterium]
MLSNIIESNVLELGQNAIINSSNPQIIKTVSTLVILKAQVMAYGDVFLIASCIMATGVIVALFLRQPKI